MTITSLTLKVIWDVDGRFFSLSKAEESIILEAEGISRISLTAAEWDGIRDGLDALAQSPRESRTKFRKDRGTAEAPKNGQAWTTDLDTALCKGWYAGEGLAVLAARFGRTEGSIASRLVRLDCVADRDEARARP